MVCRTVLSLCFNFIIIFSVLIKPVYRKKHRIVMSSWQWVYISAHNVHISMQAGGWWTVVQIFPMISHCVVVSHTPVFLANFRKSLKACLPASVGPVDNARRAYRTCWCWIFLLDLAIDSKQNQFTLVVVILCTYNESHSLLCQKCAPGRGARLPFPPFLSPVSYTHLTLPTNREV